MSAGVRWRAKVLAQKVLFAASSLFIQCNFQQFLRPLKEFCGRLILGLLIVHSFVQFNGFLGVPNSVFRGDTKEKMGVSFMRAAKIRIIQKLFTDDEAFLLSIAANILLGSLEFGLVILRKVAELCYFLHRESRSIDELYGV
jgi:hypothetical protein